MSITENELTQKMIFRSIVGEHLRWGLSEAGYLNPKIFRFFRKFGIPICSGFCMTEVTGGITMTSPENYVENSIGIHLPGSYTKRSSIGELFVRGHYIARYFDDEGTDGIIEYPENETNDTAHWLNSLIKIGNRTYFVMFFRKSELKKTLIKNLNLYK